MKIIDRVKNTIKGLRISIKRFPITIFLSTAITILLIYLSESNLQGDMREPLQRLALVLGLGILLSASIKLLVERFFKGNNRAALLLNLFGAIYLAIYYFLFTKTLDNIFTARYMGSILFFILAFLYIPRLKRKDKYEYYIMDIASEFALTFIYSFVLYFGISAILFTISTLFDVNIKGSIYYYMFLIVFFIFAISLFLSKLPEIEERYDRKHMTKSLNILLLYIVIPLISIYTAILYVYFAKILITMEWPKGLVSHLVLWYSTISVGVIFLITPILDENKFANLFKFWFPKIILPILFMMFISIYQRVNQYGITENRYYLIALGLWVLGVMLYFSIKKPLRNIVIPISLSLVILNSVFGPFSGFAISKYSQNKRLREILKSNNMLADGQIIVNKDLDIEDKREISNIISYFDSNHKLADLKYLPKGFDVVDMEELMGFAYQPYYRYPYEKEDYFYFGFNMFEQVIDISGYDYYMIMNSWNNEEKKAGDLSIRFNRINNILTISQGEEILLNEDINYYINDIYKKEGNRPIEEKRTSMNYSDMTYDLPLDHKKENFEARIIFTSVDGRLDNKDNLINTSVEFILLINY